MKCIINLASSIVLIFSILLISGCATVHTKSEIPKKLENLRALIKPELTTRAEVHELFGKPLLHSEKRGIEVYRAAEGQDAEIGLVGIIPAFIDTDDVIIYTMLLYDQDDVVREVDWDLFTEYAAASLKVGDLQFYSTGSTTELLNRDPTEYLFLQDHASAQALHEPVPSGKCLVSIELGGLTQQVLLDGDLILKVGDFEIESGFIQAPISPGNHELIMKTSFLGWRPREYSVDFSCKKGDLLYAHLDLQLVSTGKTGFFSDKSKYQGGIKIQDVPAACFQLKILYRSGQWLDKK